MIGVGVNEDSASSSVGPPKLRQPTPPPQTSNAPSTSRRCLHTEEVHLQADRYEKRLEQQEASINQLIKECKAKFLTVKVKKKVSN